MRRSRSRRRSASAKLLTQLTPIPNLSMVFLLAVLLTAISFGIWPAIYASVLSFLAYNFFFIAPLYTFTIAEPYELLALVIFLVVAVITSALAGRVREQAQGLGRPHARDAAALRIHPPAVRACRRSMRWRKARPAKSMPASAAPSWCCWREGDDLDADAPHGRRKMRSTPPPMTAARWAYSHNEPAGADTGTLPIMPWYFVPLRIGDKTLGVIGVAKDKDAPPLDSEARALLDTLSEQTAAALERASLAREMVSARDRDRNRARAQHAAGLDLARFPHAAVVDPRLGNQPDRLRRQARCGRPRRTCWRRSRPRPKASTRWCAIFWRSPASMPARWNCAATGSILREVVERVVERGAPPRRAGSSSTSSLPPICRWCGRTRRLAEQAIGNVIANAVAHTPAGTRVIVDAAASRPTRRASRHRRRPGHRAQTRCRTSSTSSSKAPSSALARRRRAGHGPRPRHRQGHHGGAWRLDRRRKPGRDGRGARIT